MPAILLPFLMLAQAAPAAGGPDLVAAITACRAIEQPAARLACFDRSAAQLETAIANSKLVVVDQEEVKRTRRSLFGISVPSIPLFKNDKSGELDEITEPIKAVRFLPYDRFMFELESGARWQTLEDGSRQREPRVGDSLRIKKGPLGSYRVSIAGRPGLRAMRVN